MRNILLALVFILLTFLALPVLLVCMLFGLRDGFLAYGRWMMKVGRRILGIKVETAGLERLDAATPCVFMSNHLSFLDGPLLMTVLDRPARVVVKRFGAGRKSISRAASLIKEKKYSFLIYPEGTRSRDGRPQRLRRGGFFLALESGAPIVPVTIHGTYELMPRGRWFVRKGPVRITFHEPIPVSGFTPESMPELIEKVRTAVISAL
jgi:1-acyl-sn-glycerol-3-phosphate acyltransferase